MTRKDVESMNRFELMNEVERLRDADDSKKLKAEIGRLQQELHVAEERILKMKKTLEFIMWRGKKPPNFRETAERRKQPQGRRKAAARRVVKS